MLSVRVCNCKFHYVIFFQVLIHWINIFVGFSIKTIKMIIINAAFLMMGSEQYCLKWNNHWTNLVRVFNSLLQSETFVDVTLACERQHLKAHRIVLASCSPYFKELLISHPDNHPIIILKDVRFSELQSLVKFMYNGEVSVEQKDISSLLCTARELQIRGLADNAIFNSIPSSFLSGPAANGASLLKIPFNSTNSSSIHLPLKPNDEPTNLTVRNKNSCSPSQPVEPGSPLLPSERPLEQRVPSPHADVGGSPVSKKRKASCLGGSESDSTDSPSQENGESPTIQRSHCAGDDPKSSDAAGPSRSALSNKDDFEKTFNPLEANGKEIRESPHPSRQVLKQPKDKPPDNLTYKGDHDLISEEDEPLNLQTPEVIIEERETEGAKTNGTCSPSPPIPAAILPKSVIMTDSSTSVSLPNPPISLLQQAMALGYPQPLPFLQSGILDQQQSKPSGSQPFASPGLVQVKSILNFVDILKAMGAGIPAGSQSNILGNLGNSNLTIGMQRIASPVSGTNVLGSSKSPSRDPDLNPLTCHICARIMPSVQVLEEHVRIHEEEKPYKCEQCGQRYKYQSAFQRHQEQNHTAKLPGDKPYRCDVCGQCFKYHKSFTKHRSNHDLIDNFMKEEPPEDNKSAIRAFQESYLHNLLNPGFAQHDPLLATIKEEAKDPSEIDPLEMRDHTDEGLSQDSKKIVDSCTTKMVSPENGEIKEEDEDIDIDEIVPDVPDDGEEDNECLGIGGSERFFYCLNCKATFRDTKTFEGHCRLSPGCSLDIMKEVAVGGDISVTSIPSSSGSSAHGSPHPSATEESITQPSSTSTNSFVFSSPPNMVCTLVSGLPTTTSFSTCAPTILNFSKFVSVSASNPSLGPRTGSDSSVLTIGNNGNIGVCSPLEEERPFKCPYCQKGFKGRENLKLHIRTHTGEKPYNCGVCGKAFGGRSDMNRHLRIHTGEKPYPCKVCGKKFARADYLSKHITTHLGIPFAKPVHSLQQSLQNLENMQNLQSVQNMSPVQILPNVQNMQPVQIIPSVQNLQPLQIIPSVQNMQSAHNIQTTTKE